MRAVKIWLAIILIFVITGCGATGNKESNNGGAVNNATNTSKATIEANTAKKTTEPAPAAGSNNEGPRTINHAMGETVLDKAPERVVILFNGMVDISAALGVKPVGAIESWDEKPWFLYLRDNMNDVTSLGEESQPNIEGIVALKPDLIIGAKGRHEKIYPQLSEIAPTIMVEEAFNWKENMTLASQALYKDSESMDVMKAWEDRVVDFKQKMGDRLTNTEVSMIRFEKDGTARIYVTGFAGSIFNELGLLRPAAQQGDKSTINLASKEQIPQLDGDYIFDITPQKDDGTNSLKNQSDWTSHPLWSTLKGVKNEHYYRVNVIDWNLGAGSIAANALLDDLYEYFELQ
ncbi:MAG: ABC transporter substrate-binding protein [Candidatus Pristimantibacillus sp.]